MENTGKFRRRETPFTQISNSLLRDNTISLKAKGLYSLIASYLSIPDFVLYKSSLRKNCSEGRDSFDKAWNELKNAGYLIQHKTQNNLGQWEYEYDLLDFSNNGNPVNGEPVTGKADSIDTLTKKEIQSNVLNDNVNLNSNVVVEEERVNLELFEEKVNSFVEEKVSISNEIGESSERYTSSVDKLMNLFKTVKGDLAKSVNSYDKQAAIELLKVAIDLFFPDEFTPDKNKPVFNKNAYLIGCMKNYA